MKIPENINFKPKPSPNDDKWADPPCDHCEKRIFFRVLYHTHFYGDTCPYYCRTWFAYYRRHPEEAQKYVPPDEVPGWENIPWTEEDL